MMNRGQLFSMDAFLSILGITLILGLVTTQFSIMYDQYNNNHFERLDSIASDMANIAVGNKMALVFQGGEKRTGVIDKNKLAEFTSFLEQTLVPEYAGKIVLFGKSEVSINGGCRTKQMQAVERRLVSELSGDAGWLEIGVCYAGK